MNNTDLTCLLLLLLLFLMMWGFGGTDVQCSSEEEVGAAAAQCRSLPGVLVDEVSFVSPNEECEAADGAPS